MANKVKEIWASGKVVVNAWLAIPSGFSAEVIAQCGFDSVTVDMQHGVQDYLSMVQCFQAMHGHPVTPMVRVPWYEPAVPYMPARMGPLERTPFGGYLE